MSVWLLTFKVTTQVRSPAQWDSLKVSPLGRVWQNQPETNICLRSWSVLYRSTVCLIVNRMFVQKMVECSQYLHRGVWGRQGQRTTLQSCSVSRQFLQCCQTQTQSNATQLKPNSNPTPTLTLTPISTQPQPHPNPNPNPNLQSKSSVALQTQLVFIVFLPGQRGKLNSIPF